MIVCPEAFTPEIWWVSMYFLMAETEVDGTLANPVQNCW